MLANKSMPGTDPEQVNAWHRPRTNQRLARPNKSTPGTDPRSDGHDYFSGITGTHNSHSNAPVFGFTGDPPR